MVTQLFCLSSRETVLELLFSLLEDQSLVPKHLCHLEGSQTLVNTSSRKSYALFWSFGHLRTGGR